MSERRPELSDDADAVTTALYELDGAIHTEATAVIVALREGERERTAAAILAALVQAPKGSFADPLPLVDSSDDLIEYAVELTDSLRAALKGSDK